MEFVVVGLTLFEMSLFVSDIRVPHPRLQQFMIWFPITKRVLGVEWPLGT